MDFLTEEKVVESINGESSTVLRYITNNKSTKENMEDIIIGSQQDSVMLERLFDYAIGASFKAKQEKNGGWTQPQRNQGNHTSRNSGQIFRDVYMGKIAEIALYKYLSQFQELDEPNLTEPGGYKNSDAFDMVWNNKYISIKCTEHYGDLLLLQKTQYDEKGQYLPNLNSEKGPRFFDYHVLCKVGVINNVKWKQSIGFAMKNQISEKELDELKEIMMNLKFSVKIAGYLSEDDFINKVIGENMVVYADNPSEKTYRMFGRGEYSKWSSVDVDNYYVQSGGLTPISQLPGIAKSITEEESKPCVDKMLQGKIKYAAYNNEYAYILGDDGDEYIVTGIVIGNSIGRHGSLRKGARVEFSAEISEHGRKYAVYVKYAVEPIENPVCNLEELPF